MRTIYQANRDLGNNFGRRNNTIPSTYYIGLSTSSTITEVGFTEPTGGGYERVALVNSTSNFTVPANGAITINAAIEYPETTAVMGNVYAVGIFDAATGGNMLYYGALTTSKYVESETILQFRAGTITINALDS